MASLLKWLATNAISWDIGRQSALGPKSLKIKHQAFPHDGSTGLKLPAPASLPVTDNHHGAGDRVQLDVAGRSKNFLVDTGATYSVLTSYPRAFSSQICTIWGATEKTITKIFTQALLCCCDGQIFLHPFLVVPECPTPLLGTDLSPPLKSCNYWCSPPGSAAPGILQARTLEIGRAHV